MSDMFYDYTHHKWTKNYGDHTRTAHLEVNSEGIVRVQYEVLADMLTQLGWYDDCEGEDDDA